MKKLPSLSIFFPAFNEEINIKIVVNEALSIASNISEKFEILVVDDGSTDKIAEVVRRLSEKYPNIRLIQHEVNKGYGAALKTGFYNSKYEYITYMDSDHQFNFSEIHKLLEFIWEFDIVVGFRIKRADNFIRILNGHIWTMLMKLILGINLKDVDCGFKLINRKALDNISKLESNGATISAELLAKAKKSGFKIKEVGLLHQRRKYGRATGGNIKHILRALVDLVKLEKSI